MATPEMATWEARTAELLERLDDGIEPTDSLDELRRLVQTVPEDVRMTMVTLPACEWSQRDEDFRDA